MNPRSGAGDASDALVSDQQTKTAPPRTQLEAEILALEALALGSAPAPKAQPTASPSPADQATTRASQATQTEASSLFTPAPSKPQASQRSSARLNLATAAHSRHRSSSALVAALPLASETSQRTVRITIAALSFLSMPFLLLMVHPHGSALSLVTLMVGLGIVGLSAAWDQPQGSASVQASLSTKSQGFSLLHLLVIDMVTLLLLFSSALFLGWVGAFGGLVSVFAGGMVAVGLLESLRAHHDPDAESLLPQAWCQPLVRCGTLILCCYPVLGIPGVLS